MEERGIPLNEMNAAHIPEGFAMISVVYRQLHHQEPHSKTLESRLSENEDITTPGYG